MKKIRYDLLLAALVLAAAGVFWLLSRPGGEGAYAVVTRGGTEIGRYDLSKDVTVKLGDQDYNLLQIQSGAAAIIQANCGDHTCVRTGWVSREGETIVCLPHELVVEIHGGSHSAFDATTG